MGLRCSLSRRTVSGTGLPPAMALPWRGVAAVRVRPSVVAVHGGSRLTRMLLAEEARLVAGTPALLVDDELTPDDADDPPPLRACRPGGAGPRPRPGPRRRGRAATREAACATGLTRAVRPSRHRRDRRLAQPGQARRGDGPLPVRVRRAIRPGQRTRPAAARLGRRGDATRWVHPIDLAVVCVPAPASAAAVAEAAAAGALAALVCAGGFAEAGAPEYQAGLADVVGRYRHPAARSEHVRLPGAARRLTASFVPERRFGARRSVSASSRPAAA